MNFEAQLENLAAITNEMPEIAFSVTGLSNLNKEIDSIINSITFEINGLKEIFENLALRDAQKKADRRDKKRNSDRLSQIEKAKELSKSDDKKDLNFDKENYEIKHFLAASDSKAENLDMNMEIIGSGNTFGNDEDEAVYLDEKSGQFKLAESTLGI